MLNDKIKKIIIKKRNIKTSINLLNPCPLTYLILKIKKKIHEITCLFLRFKNIFKNIKFFYFKLIFFKIKSTFKNNYNSTLKHTKSMAGVIIKR